MRLFSLSCLFLLILIDASATEELPDTIRIGYSSAAPFILEEQGRLEGISIWLWDKIANDLEQPYELVPMVFKDILKGLEEGSIDASINPLTVTSDRGKRMDFTHPFFASNSTIVVRDRTSLQQLFQLVRSVLSLNFLRGMVALIAIIGLFGVITWLFERKQNPVQFRPGILGLWDGLWWSAVTMTTVGYGDKAPKSTAGKVVALIWMFTAILSISGLTASITSSLTVNQMSSNPKTVEDFKDIKVGTVRASATMDYLRHHHFKDISQYDGLADGLRSLKSGAIEAFLYDEPILKYRLSMEEEYKGLKVIPVKFDLQFYAFAFAKNQYQLKEAVSQSILEKLETLDWRYLLAEYDLSQL